MKSAIYKNFNNEYTNIPNELDIQIIENKYKKNNTILLKKEYDELFKKYLSEENFIKNNKKEVLKKFYEDSKYVYEQLKFLPEIGIDFNLDLTGGSVRDFILNREEEIKDLDFMLNIDVDFYTSCWINSVSDEEHWKNDKNKFLNKIEKIKKTHQKDFYFIIDLLENYSYKKGNDTDDYFVLKYQLQEAILSYCFQGEIKENFLKSKIFKLTDYSGERLEGVIKLKKQNYDIDLLITNYHKKDFLSCFDFNLCKASFSLLGFHHKKFIESENDFLERASIDISFFADIKNQKLTVDVDKLSIKDIEHSMNSHYVRLKRKYPEYTINIIGKNQEKLKICQIFFEYNELKNNLNKVEKKLKTQVKI
jgi:hypothetical protein